MSDPITLGSFPDLSVEDTISLTRSSSGSAEDAEFILESGPGITWWKGIAIYSATGALLGRASTQDATTVSDVVRVPGALLPGAKLVFAKAKMFGVHTGMYEMIDLAAHRGRRLHFLWQRDEHRNGPVAGFFRDVGNGISTAADAVAGFVEGFVNAVAEFVADIFELVGTAIKDFFDILGNALGPPFREIFHWLGSVISAVFNFVGAVIKGVLGLVAGVVAGVIRIVGGAIGGFLAWDGRVLVRGIADFFSGIGGAIVAIVGTFGAFLNTVFGAQWIERGLTPEEAALLRRVYRGSIALYNVRVVVGGSGIFSVNGSRFVLGNTIYMKDTPPEDFLAVLVHEACHVWHYQHLGTRYITDALGAQARGMSAYDWRAELRLGGRRWQDFNLEAQAELLEDVYRFGRRTPVGTSGPGSFFDEDPLGDDVHFIMDNENFTEFARESIAYIRGARSWRISGFF